ncbi:MAG TPA: hypothetical protein VGR62_00055 [Candidatus Binatia bacterium]|jgi:hypothetical protein|nr:hypothetical protein [Candidatus Binatia bacterium]
MRKPSRHPLIALLLLMTLVAGAGAFFVKVENPLPGVHPTFGMPDVLGVAGERPEVGRADAILVLRYEATLGSIPISRSAEARIRLARIAQRPAFHPRRPPPRSLVTDSAPSA